MTRKLERDFLQSELAAVEALLRRMPPEDMLGRIGFESRRNEIARPLDNLDATPATRAATLLQFGGRPVLGARGIESDFAGKALEKSRAALREVMQASLKSDGRIKGFRPDVAAFFGYLIAHDAHHRGQITMLARQAGHPISQKTMFGMWEWGVR